MTRISHRILTKVIGIMPSVSFSALCPARLLAIRVQENRMSIPGSFGGTRCDERNVCTIQPHSHLGLSQYLTLFSSKSVEQQRSSSVMPHIMTAPITTVMQKKMHLVMNLCQTCQRQSRDI
ncbi:hypothetical protein V8C37DRAFT_373302 [Trichoderma ceciliae]